MSVDLSVFDFFENVVLMLGWIVNNAIWDFLNTSLLAGIPFVALIMSEWYRARGEGEDEGNKGLLALNRIETALYAMIIIYIFTAAPVMTVTFAPVNINQQHLQECGVRVASGGTSSTAGATLGGQSAKIPVWWAATHALSHGATNVALDALPCQTDYRYLRTELDHTAIDNPELRHEVANFQRWCYGQSRQKLLASDPDLTAEEAQDVDWIGSQYFLTHAGYYDSFEANRPIPGFAYQPERDSGNGTDPAQGGYPSCQEWWQAPGSGLRARLHEQINTSLWQNIHAAFTSSTADDYAIRALLQTKRGGATGNAGAEAVANNNGGQGFLSWLTGSATGALGAGLATVPAIGMKDVVSRALPMVQYLLLMALVISLPFLTVISGYSFKVAGVITFGYFGLVSLSFWFALARWLDNHLVAMLYQSNAAKMGFMAGLTNAYDISVLGLVQASMLFVLPSAWLAMLGWAGARAGGGLSGALEGGSRKAAAAGEKGGQKAQSTATKGKA